eukprot:scaffold1638_cov258-Pinguiococcus_pyrenoidosus.AAC.49
MAEVRGEGVSGTLGVSGDALVAGVMGGAEGRGDGGRKGAGSLGCMRSSPGELSNRRNRRMSISPRGPWWSMGTKAPRKFLHRREAGGVVVGNAGVRHVVILVDVTVTRHRGQLGAPRTLTEDARPSIAGTSLLRLCTEESLLNDRDQRHEQHEGEHQYKERQVRGADDGERRQILILLVEDISVQAAEEGGEGVGEGAELIQVVSEEDHPEKTEAQEERHGTKEEPTDARPGPLQALDEDEVLRDVFKELDQAAVQAEHRHAQGEVDPPIRYPIRLGLSHQLRAEDHGHEAAERRHHQPILRHAEEVAKGRCKRCSVNTGFRRKHRRNRGRAARDTVRVGARERVKVGIGVGRLAARLGGNRLLFLLLLLLRGIGLPTKHELPQSAHSAAFSLYEDRIQQTTVS